MKDLLERLQSWGPTAGVGAAFVLAGIVLMTSSSVNGFDDLTELLARVAASFALGALLVMVGSSLLVYRVDELTNLESSRLSGADREILVQIISAFEREAFRQRMTDRERSEDLRAMFSAFNQTRITLQKLRRRISNPLVSKLLESTYDDFEGIRRLSPWDPEETEIAPSHDRMRKEGEREWVNKWAEETQEGRTAMAQLSKSWELLDPYYRLVNELGARRIPLIGIVEAIDRILRTTLAQS